MGLHLWDHRGDRFRIEHRYTRETSKSVYLEAFVNLNQRLAAHAEYEQDLFEAQRLQAGFGLIYTAQCWSVDTRYTEELEERRLGFMINLFGIGGLGS